MDTRWRKFSLFNGLKVMIVVVMILSVVAIIPSFAYVEEFSNLSSGTDKNTYLFEEKFNGLIHNVVEYYVVLKNEEHIRSSPEDVNSPDVSSQIPSNLNETTEIDNGDVEYKLDRLHAIEQHLADTVNFIYYIENVPPSFELPKTPLDYTKLLFFKN